MIEKWKAQYEKDLIEIKDILNKRKIKFEKCYNFSDGSLPLHPWNGYDKYTSIHYDDPNNIYRFTRQESRETTPPMLVPVAATYEREHIERLWNATSGERIFVLILSESTFNVGLGVLSKDNEDTKSENYQNLKKDDWVAIMSDNIVPIEMECSTYSGLVGKILEIENNKCILHVPQKNTLYGKIAIAEAPICQLLKVDEQYAIKFYKTMKSLVKERLD